MRIIFTLSLVVLLLGCATEDHKPRIPQESTNTESLTTIDSEWGVSEGISRTQESSVPQVITETELQSAIDSVRGVNIQGISYREKMQIGRQLDTVWRKLEKQPEQAKELLREALSNETEDDFFLIDLSEQYLRLDQKPTDIEDVSRWLVRADPNAYADAYFIIASHMAAFDSESSKPVVLRMLELEQLESYIAAHALSIDLEMGLLFTVAPYGEEIVPDVTVHLNSPNCVVRANAAHALSMLLPPVTPPEIEIMATSDSCERARHSGMRSLAVMEPPALVRVLNNKIRDLQGLDQSELQAIVMALELAPPRVAMPYLKELSRHPIDDVSQAAVSTLEVFKKASGIYRVPRLNSSKDERARARLLRDLTLATQKHRFKSSMSSPDMVTVLQDKDYPLLNKARVSVLRRLSDECMYEFATLNGAALLFREEKRLYK